MTLTDLFCGCGGSTSGAKRAGAEVRQAMNHWKLAVDSHNTNHPETLHDCADISETHPMRYRRTTGLIGSPECTNHSLAAGQRRTNLDQGDFFNQTALDPAAVRSRATMWDIVRFTEAHQYEFVITENVVDVRRWTLFEPWLRSMHALGYKHRCVYLNGQFAHKGPGSESFAPQSRDRIYIVFWKKGNKAPNLEITPRGWCMDCSCEVNALQSWKKGRTWGKYKQQYVYRCPLCTNEMTPYYFAGLNAIDFGLPAMRIGDREANGKQPLKPKTIARIEYGLKKFGMRPLVVQTRYTSGIECRVRPGEDPLPTHVGGAFAALVHPGTLAGLAPFMVETAYSHSGDNRAVGGEDALAALTGRASMAVVSPHLMQANRIHSPSKDLSGEFHTITTSTSGAFIVQDTPQLVGLGRNGYSHPADGPNPTQTTADVGGVLMPPGFTVPLRENGTPRTFAEVLQTFAAGGNHHMLIGPSAMVTLRGPRSLSGLDAPVGVQVGTIQDWLLTQAPFLTPFYGVQASGSDEATPTMTAGDRVGVVTPVPPAVDDCYFRMFQPHEMQRGQGFADDYVVLGTKRDKVKQIGNANPPPTMELLVERCLESLA